MLQVKQHIYRAHHIRVSQLKSNIVSAITTSELVNKMFLYDAYLSGYKRCPTSQNMKCIHGFLYMCTVTVVTDNGVCTNKGYRHK